jgi:MFS transporter, NNP family, nitrate/nitrite transporter
MSDASTATTRPAHRIGHWDPEDPVFWAARGRAVAQRNLLVSVFTEHLGFSVWSLWPVLVLFMVPAAGFPLTTAGKFLLVSLVTLTGALLRVPYALAVGRFGGRNWTVMCTAVLVVPAVLAAFAAAHPGLPAWVFFVAAGVAGLGGGNFASSMANINFFYREAGKGRALGLNAGGGNLGVAVTQLAGLLVIAVAGVGHPAYLPLAYLPLLVVAVFCAARYMDNLPGTRSGLPVLSRVLADRDCWLLSLLYTGTFGSFIGYGFAFGLVLQQDFGRTPLQAASLTFLGPLLGSLARPAGGALADRFGGASVTGWAFAGLLAGTAVVMAASLRHSLPAFVAGFAAVFVLSGAGNGSACKLIAAVYDARARAGAGTARTAAGRDHAGAGRDRASGGGAGGGLAQALAEARRTSSAVLGVAGAVGALGGVAVNLVFRQSYASGGTAAPAFAVFCAFYLVCMGLIWAAYGRHRALVPAPGTACGEAGA